jgi:hypothetical protein
VEVAGLDNWPERTVDHGIRIEFYRDIHDPRPFDRPTGQNIEQAVVGVTPRRSSHR